MTISNYYEFYNLVKDDMSSVVSQLSECIRQSNSICSCQKDRKQRKIEECNTIYIEFIKSNAEGLVEYLKTKTQDKSVIFKHSTHYPITTVNLN